MQNGIENYNDHYFLSPTRIGKDGKPRRMGEVESYLNGVIRAGDMGAAICYCLGIDSYAEVKEVMEIPENSSVSRPGMNYYQQVSNLAVCNEKNAKANCIVWIW